ncbi:hypothetical protein [Pseudomonas oryzae]|uniref:Uncharacterized protein n=1 Tax=Pseudomonas oryzae TaxID=1392877 RepID=A0A1H1ZJJ2_9PSED|nr:hypothetical protein [Pseudomonas oryzae]SDT33955.1 hypothetical protein SAMN05216221_4298 [Pseudomonas oryzae]
MSKAYSRASQAVGSVKALQALLVQIIQRPQQFSKDADIRSALKSQGSLASVNLSVEVEQGESLQTFPMSLNTLKTHANENLAGGFKALNELRLKAIDALEFAEKREQLANKRTKSGLAKKVAQLEFELEIQRQTNVILLRALSEAMHQFTSIRDASDDNIRAKRTQDALQVLRAIASMNKPPFNLIPTLSEGPAPSVEVANIDDYRKG